MKDQLLALERWIRTELFPGSGSLWYSDTGAILERGWAERAGLGWVGKHAGVLSETLGSWFLLGEVLMDRELVPDAPVQERCGTCTRCLDGCPTQAIVAPYQVDARRCISYLTIELAGPIPRELRPLVGDWIFGCDICQDVCPWNRFAPPAREARLHGRSLEGWSLERFLTLDEPAFTRAVRHQPDPPRRARGLPAQRVRGDGQSRCARSTPRRFRARWPRDPAALVRGHAAWALGRVAEARPGAARDEAAVVLAHAARADADAWVREEAALALDALGARVSG